MTRSMLAVRVLLALAVAAPVAAQKRPDFSGTWVEDVSQRKISPAERSPATSKGAMAMEDPPQVITQTVDSITVAQTFMGQTSRITHTLNGRENKNRQGAQVHTTRTRWEGNKLVTEGTNHQVTSAGEESWKRREVRSLTPRGEMVVETTQVDEDGKSRAVTQVFTRAK